MAGGKIVLFSVVIPAYNCGESLEKTVESIMASGLFDFELVIVDDGSTDGMAEVCRGLQARFDNIRCFRQENAGVSTARNRGLEEARGDYLLFFDADDTVDPGALKHAAEIAAETRPDMLIFGLSFDYYLHGKMYRRDELVYAREGLLDRKQWAAEFSELFRCNALSPVWNKFIRRDMLMEHRIRFRKDLIEMEDFLFVLQCMECCGNIYILPAPLYRYRQAEDEMGTYRRLCRILSLSAYMQPFEEAAQSLKKSLGLPEEEKQLENVIYSVYATLFWERIHFGSTDEIKITAEDMLSGPYWKTIEQMQSERYSLLRAGKYRRVWLQNAKIRLRHWIAVRIKFVVHFWRK